MIDLTDRIIQPARGPLKAPNGNLRWHPLRRAVQVVTGLLFVLLPLTNGMRLDVRRNIFYYAWHRTVATDIYLLFWIAMFAVSVVAAVSFLYGRVWCASVCPQTLASDFADSIKRRLDKALRARPGNGTFVLSRSVWTLAMLAMSVGTGIILADYWLDPHEVWRGTLSPGSDPVVAWTVYGIAAFVAADLLWVRRKFCSDACPYGPLMGVLADENTLAVRYLDERDDDCIRCGKCVTDCPMDIDIKQGVGQLACIGCGECVDACNTVLGKRGIPGLIELRYGLEPERVTQSLPLKQRLGLWDLKRIMVVATAVASLGFTLWLMFGGAPTQAMVQANGAITSDAAGSQNTYTLTITNGQPEPEPFTVTVASRAALTVVAPAGPVTVGAHESSTVPLTISASPQSVPGGDRVPVTVVAESPASKAATQTIFYAPLH